MIRSGIRDDGPAEPHQAPAGVLRGALLAVRGLAESAVDSQLNDVSDAALIDMLADLRRLRAATAALEAQVQVAFDASQREQAMGRGVPRRDAGKGVAEQVALARGVSSWRAANDLALARGLVGELPRTLEKLVAGSASELAVLNVARETVCLMPEDRAVVDERVAKRLDGMSPRRAAGLARSESARVDAESVTRRIRQAEKDRCVTVRPAPDAMVYLSALLPVKSGVAAYAALCRHADTLKASGDERSRGAIMADTLVARLTGVEDAAQIPVEIQLVMPATTLLAPSEGPAGAVGGQSVGDQAADVEGRTSAVGGGDSEVCGWIGEHPIPGEIAREIALIPDDAAQRWVRRLFTDPVSGDVTTVDERRRLFTGAMRRAIIARDRACRSCGSPIRHIDHVTAYADGGATTMQNGQGLCQRCNQAKTQPGWSARGYVIEGRHVTVTSTPTGHTYVSQPPPPIIEPPPREQVPLETRVEAWLERARREGSPKQDVPGADVIFPRAWADASDAA